MTSYFNSELLHLLGHRECEQHSEYMFQSRYPNPKCLGAEPFAHAHCVKVVAKGYQGVAKSEVLKSGSA